MDKKGNFIFMFNIGNEWSDKNEFKKVHAIYSARYFMFIWIPKRGKGNTLRVQPIRVLL